MSRADLAAPGAPFGPENAEMLNRILWRAARFGFALAAVLVLYGLWIWQRRRF